MYTENSGTYYEIWSKKGQSMLPGTFETKEEAENEIKKTKNQQIKAGFTPQEWNIMQVFWQTFRNEEDEIVFHSCSTVKV